MRVALKVSMLHAGMSQRAVAHAAGMAESRLSEIVRGWREPNTEERTKISSVLHQPAAVLFDQGSVEIRQRCI